MSFFPLMLAVVDKSCTLARSMLRGNSSGRTLRPRLNPSKLHFRHDQVEVLGCRAFAGHRSWARRALHCGVRSTNKQTALAASLRIFANPDQLSHLRKKTDPIHWYCQGKLA